MASAVYVFIAISMRLPGSKQPNQGMWHCRVTGPSDDTGDFWLDEPYSFGDAAPVEIVEKISETNPAAGCIIAEAVRDGRDVFLREEERNWPKVEGISSAPRHRF